MGGIKGAHHRDHPKKKFINILDRVFEKVDSPDLIIPTAPVENGDPYNRPGYPALTVHDSDCPMMIMIFDQ